MHLLQVYSIVLFIISMSNAEFKKAQHGQPCLFNESPFEPMKVCDFDKGLDCRGRSKSGFVCSCYGSFVYDTVGKECRRKVGDYCQLARIKDVQKKPWNEKCQTGSVCSKKGTCVCKKGLVHSGFSSTCIPQAYTRGGTYYRKF